MVHKLSRPEYGEIDANRTILETAKLFRRGIEKYCALSEISFKDYCFQHGFDPASVNSPWKERVRVGKILQFLRENIDAQEFRRAIESSEEFGLSGGITWQQEYDFKSDEVVKRPYVFLNETAMHHFRGCMFGTQSQTSPFFSLMHSHERLDWESINPLYFQELQAETKQITDEATRIRREIVRSEKIFRCCVKDRTLWVYDPNWNLPAAEMRFPSVEREWWDDRPTSKWTPTKLKDDASKGIVPLEIYQLNMGSRLTLYDLVSDKLVRGAFSDCILDEQRWLRDDSMKVVREVAYMAKEKERIGEVEKIGGGMISVYDKVIEILDAIKVL